MSETASLLIATARRMVATLRNETRLARMGALADLAQASEDKETAFRDFARAWNARDVSATPSPVERDELRQILAAADENAVILEAVGNTLGDLSARVRTAATTALDPGTYSPRGRDQRHVRAARVDASV